MATCKNCNHFNACSKWTDFPNQCGVPVCARFEEKSAWISVDERLPEECTHVIVHDEDGTVGEAFYSRGGYFEWVANEGIAFSTHWMPLPEPPMMKGGEQP